MNESRKRIDIVKIKVVKEDSITYSPRKIGTPEDTIELIKYMVDGSDRENFIVICLDTKNQPTHVELCSKGTLNASLVHPREVFKMAIVTNAASIIIAHNHPSGNIEPSREDIALTERLSEASKIIGISLLDHVIVGDEQNNEFYSFKENGLI